VPEGHTIHRLAARHADALAGLVVAVDSPQGRFTGAPLVDGTCLEGTDAWGKHLFYDFEAERTVHVHLGLYGTFTDQPVPPPPPRPTCRMRLATADHVMDLVGPITCEVLDPEGRHAVVARLGPDPLRPDADPRRFRAALARRRTPVGRALLDQGVVAGVGNVYRAEALFVLGISPTRPARDLDADEVTALWATLVAMLERGRAEGRIVTVDPAEAGVPRHRQSTRDGRYVYRRDTCRRCEGPVRRWDMAGRWAYACPTCQPD
jgi:endonuclease VIII